MKSQPGRVPARPDAAVLSIGEAAARLGVSERALRYYQELGLVTPSGQTPGGMRRYSEEDLARVARIRELQKLLGLNLDEVAAVLDNDDRLARIREAYHDRHTSAQERSLLCREYIALQEELRATVEAKQAALASFLADIEARVDKARSVLGTPTAS